jgi:hypothetical protein
MIPFKAGTKRDATIARTEITVKSSISEKARNLGVRMEEIDIRGFLQVIYALYQTSHPLANNAASKSYFIT